MIRSKPAIYFKITPINPTGVTVADLGEMDDIPPASVAKPMARRHSSLPPPAVTETGTSHREGRHRSLPPKTVTIVSPASTSFEALETVSEGNSDNDTTRVSFLLLISTTTILTAFEITNQGRGSTEPSSTDAASQREGVHKGSRLCTSKVSCRA
jgi:hypothetical protein